MPRGGPVFRKPAASGQELNSLTASARTYSSDGASRKVRKTGRQTNSREWQRYLWDFYDEVPEYRMGCDWVGNSLSRVKLTVLKNGEPTEDAEAKQALEELFAGEAGQREMMRVFGINFTVAGEAWLIGEDAGDRDVWEVYAASEITGEDKGRLVIDGDRFPDNVLPVRVWKRHPRRSNEANSPSRALIPILNEIITLTKVVDAQATSRLTSAGILWVPIENDVAVATTTSPGDDETVQPSTLSLYDVMIRNAGVAIADRDSAAAQVPLVVSVPGEFLEKVQKTDFWSGFDEHAKTLRDEAIRRLAVGMDLPPEVLNGTADVNHWGAWQIEEAAVKSYIEPLALLLADSLAEGYLRPALEGMGVKNVEEYTFGIDSTQLRLRPNRSKEAVELYDRGITSRETVLRENGFDIKNDLMGDDERETWLTLQVAKGSTTPEQVTAALNALGVELPQVGAVADRPELANPSQHRRSLEEHPNQGPPDPDRSESEAAKAEKGLLAGAAMTSSPSTPLEALAYASEVMVYRALERAGNRIKTMRSDRPAGVAAVDLYRHLEKPLTLGEATSLLEDAWSAADRMNYPGVNVEALKFRLNTYAASLLISGAEMRRSHLTTMLDGAV